jgi:hypothetical protein
VIKRLLASTVMGVAVLGTVQLSAGSARASWVAVRVDSASLDDLVGLAAVVMAGGILGWVGLLSALAAAAQVPGLAARAMAQAVLRLAPSLVIGLVRIGLGLAVVSTPVMATLPATAVGGSVKSRDDGDGASPAAAVPPGVGRPGDTPVRSAAVESTTTRALQESPADVPIRDGATASAEVVVVPGDCLWTIAARAIGPDATDAEIAAAWPRWYARNRAAIGADPDLLIPGTVLRPPA